MTCLSLTIERLKYKEFCRGHFPSLLAIKFLRPKPCSRSPNEREGVLPCRLVECIALCQIPLSAADEAALLAIVDENLCHPAASIQDAAAAALHAMARSYLKGVPVQCIPVLEVKHAPVQLTIVVL